MSNSQETDELSLSPTPESTPEPEQNGEPQPAAEEASQLCGVLKCYFYTPKRGDVWGAFCFLFNGSTGEGIDNVFWITRALVSPPIDVNMGWRELNKLIPQMGVYEKSMGDKLAASMLELFPPSDRIEMCAQGDISGILNRVSTEIRNNFERTTHYFLEFSMGFERLSQQEMVDAGVYSGKDGKAAEGGASDGAEEEKTFHGTLITCLPVIDPVRGVPVSDLRPGDRVEVKIQGGVGAGELIQKYLSSTSQDAVFPVESVESKDNDRTYVLLNISDEVRGLITVTKDLRLRTLQMSDRKRTVISINLDNAVLFGVLAVAAVVILLVVKFFF